MVRVLIAALGGLASALFMLCKIPMVRKVMAEKDVESISALYIITELTGHICGGVFFLGTKAWVMLPNVIVNFFCLLILAYYKHNYDRKSRSFLENILDEIISCMGHHQCCKKDYSNLEEMEV